jgi:hypothetical protein
VLTLNFPGWHFSQLLSVIVLGSSPGLHPRVGFDVGGTVSVGFTEMDGAGDGSSVGWNEIVGSGVGAHVYLSGSDSQQGVPISKLLLRTKESASFVSCASSDMIELVIQFMPTFIDSRRLR